MFFVDALAVADSHDLDDGSLTLEPSQDAVDANARAPAAPGALKRFCARPEAVVFKLV